MKIEPTLCFPDSSKTCFACCPPIRPAGYEHIQHINILKRIFRENRLLFIKYKMEASAITGFSCWALGYLDDRYEQIGCLLHPAQNDGKDPRFLTGYKEKCRREICPEAKEFLRFDIVVRKQWLGLTDGLDSFFYSSKKNNPLFGILGWGTSLLNLIAKEEDGSPFLKEAFLRTYPFFSTSLSPRAYSYLLNSVVEMKGPGLLKKESFLKRFEDCCLHISDRLKPSVVLGPDARFTHLLELEAPFLNYVRLGLELRRIDPEQAFKLKQGVDQAIQEFCDGI
jgi:hypothetical protein